MSKYFDLPCLIGLKKEELENTRRFVVMSITTWENNEYKKSDDDRLRNEMYFKAYLAEIDKSLVVKKHRTV